MIWVEFGIVLVNFCVLDIGIRLLLWFYMISVGMLMVFNLFVVVLMCLVFIRLSKVDWCFGVCDSVI